MKVLDNHQLKILKSTGSAVALGTFDGMHLGHKRIINSAKENANGVPVVCYTFENIPASIFDDRKKPIFTLEEKLEALEKQGVDYVYMPKFTREFAASTREEFLDFLRDELNAKVLSAGFNYTFGYGARGDAAFMKEYAKKHGMRAIVCDKVTFEGKAVSSSRIREALLNRDMKSAHAMLGEPFALSGKVVYGKRLGGKIGFPTANFEYPDKIEICRGVYVTRVCIDNVYYPSITNIGVRPTVENTDRMNVETHIIGFEGDLYGKTVKVEFFSFLREECKFSGVEQLVFQLEKDKKIALQYDFSVIK